MSGQASQTITARGLQKAVMEDLDRLFQGDRFRTPDGGMAAPKAYAQFLPKRQTHSIGIREAEDDGYPEALEEAQEEQTDTPEPEAAEEPQEPEEGEATELEDDDPFPYIIVRIDSGDIRSQDDAHLVTMVLIPGIYDPDPENNGHLAVLEICERIQAHYQENPVLGGATFVDPFRYALQDEESFPYFFGACSLTFKLPAPRTEWSEFT